MNGVVPADATSDRCGGRRLAADAPALGPSDVSLVGCPQIDGSGSPQRGGRKHHRRTKSRTPVIDVPGLHNGAASGI